MAPRRGRKHGIPLDGILLVDKPQDWTSHDVVNFVRGRYRLKKVGHGGTLDPMATGLLVLLMGKGTKCSDRVMEGQKVYEGTIKLGETTNSQDADGIVEETRPLPENLTREKLEAILPAFRGDILQIPPMVSAIKKDGVPLYKIARRGESIERPPRPVTIYSYEILDLRLPEIDIRVVCSKGTYIRTLAHDFGQALGCGAHLCALRRTFSGSYDVSQAVAVDDLREMELSDMQKRLLPLPVLQAKASLPRHTRFDELPETPVVLAIGAFDGLHRGHQNVIQQARHLAVGHQAQTGIMRFAPHPSRVLNPEKAPPLLSTEDQIQQLLTEQGIDFQLRLPFTPQVANLEAETFLDQLHSQIPQLKGVVVGPNWRFGKQGRGDLKLLQAWAANHHIDVVIAQEVLSETHMISSTRIRQEISEGHLEAAAKMLGRPYRLNGVVKHGKKYGRELGFPTANFDPHQDHQLPPSGVYAMRVSYQGQSYLGAGYITQDPRLVEVHLLDFEGDLYDQPLEVDVIRHQRSASPIPDPETLRKRIQQDVEEIRTYLNP
ncbi:tRNA pseudouridine(55) synthase TruB [Kiritimatiellota bacterium B12222]|nr:tRNA pseudouridine(55) synthase TruB [Kiritimatiellota bacterium B12222]